MILNQTYAPAAGGEGALPPSCGLPRDISKPESNGVFALLEKEGV